MNQVNEWIDKHFLGENAKPPFSFLYDGKPSRDFLEGYRRSVNVAEGADVRVMTVTWKDPATGLLVRCETRLFKEFPAVEWVLRFENQGKVDTPILENIQALDTTIKREKDDEFILHLLKGDTSSRDSFTPLSAVLHHWKHMDFSCVLGRSSSGSDRIVKDDGVFPFFNVAFDDGGIFTAIGWTGQWKAGYGRDAEKGLQITAGMAHTRLKLLPGESIRSPGILLFFWKGERIEAHNDFRRLLLKYHTPQKEGKPAESPISVMNWIEYGNGMNEQNQLETIRGAAAKTKGFENFWMDAGWYGDVADWGRQVGSWYPVKTAFPNGLKPLGNEAKKNGLGFVLWFEPERVYPDTWLYKNHPEWLLMPSERTTRWREKYIWKAEALFNFGNPAARQWLTDHFSSIIQDNNVTVYRQDCNFDLLYYWRDADALDRQGLAEIRYIEGLYTFLDDLRRRNLGLLVDNCASGGRRFDIEMMSRSVSLWRCDHAFDPTGSTAHTLGLHLYVPCHGAGFMWTDPYKFRCMLAPAMVGTWNELKDASDLDKRIDEFKQIRPLFHGDFYSLTEHSTNDDVWCGYQLYRKDLGRGAIVILKREKSPYRTATFKLHGLDPDHEYELVNADTQEKFVIKGEVLLKDGLTVDLPASPGSALFWYKA